MSDAKITFETRFDSSQFENSVRDIDKSLNNMRSTVMKVSSASLDTFGKPTRNEIEKTTVKLAKKSQEIQNVIDKLSKMSKQYEDLASQNAEPKILTSMSRELDNIGKKIIREQNAIKRFTDEGVKLQTEMANIEAYRSGGRNLEETQSFYDDALKSITQNNEMLKGSEDLLERLKARAEELTNQISKVKLNPENTDEAIKLKQDLTQTEQILQILNYEASSLEGNLNKAFEQGGANKVNRTFKSLSNFMGKISNKLKTATAGMKVFGKESRKSFSTVERIANRIKRIAAATIFYQIFRSLFRGVRQYVEALLKSNEQISNSMATLKFNIQVAFQPLWQAVVPTLQKITDMLVVATSYLASFTNMLFGKSLAGSQQAVKDLKAQEDGYNKTGKAAKKAGKQVQGFDILNKMSNKDDSDDSDESAFDNIKIPDIDPVWFNKLSEIMAGLKNALDPTIKSLKNLWEKGLKPLKNFTWKALKDFWEHFLKPVGNWVLGEGLPRFVDAITNGLQKVNWGRLNKSLNNFWDALAPFSIKIGEGLLWFWENVLVPLATWTVSYAVPRFLDSISDALDRIDWDAIGSSLAGFWDALAPFAELIGEGLFWFWEEVLIPLGLWLANSTIPALIDFISAAIETLTLIIEINKPILTWLWEELLLPLGQWTGEIIIGAIDGLTSMLEKFSAWASENEEAVRLMGVAVGILLGYFALYTLKQNLIPKIGQLITTLAKFGRTIATMLQSVTPAGLAVAIMAGAIVYLGSNWDKLNGAERAATILGGLASAAIVASIAIAAFHASWSVGLAAAAIAGGLTAIGIGYSRLKNKTGVNFSQPQPNIMGQASGMSVPNATPGEGIAFASMLKGSPPLPRLAKGGLIPPRKPRQVIVGDNMVEDEIVSPVSTMKKAFAEVLVESGNYNKSNDNVVLLEILNAIKEGSIMVVNDRELGRVIAESNRDIDTRTGIRVR